MHYLLPILLAAPAAMASFGVPVGGSVKAERDEMFGAPDKIHKPGFWDIEDPAPGTCIDQEHAECLLHNYNKVWSGNFTLVNYTLSENIMIWYNGTGGEAPGAPMSSGRSETWQYIYQSVLNPNAAWQVVAFKTMYFFIGCQSIAQRWTMVGRTTGHSLHPGQDVSAGYYFELRGTDLIRVTQEKYNDKLYWMVLEGVTSEDDGNIDYQYSQLAAKLTAMGGSTLPPPSNSPAPGSGAKRGGRKHEKRAHTVKKRSPKTIKVDVEEQ